MKNTTLNVDCDVLLEINNIAEFYNMSSALIVKRILVMMESKFKFSELNGKLKKYQKHCPVNGFRQFRICFSEMEVDEFSYLSYRLRLSLSHILFIGFLLFFKELVNDLKEKGVKMKNSYTYIINLYQKYLDWHINYIKKYTKKETKRQRKGTNRT